MNTNPTPPGPDGPFARFRREHALVLELLADLERCVLFESRGLDERRIAEALALLADQFATHMAAEDAVLYPAIHEAFPAGRATLEPLRADHAELRQMLSALSRQLDEAASQGRDEQLRVGLRDLVDLLRLHIHREESAVFDVASRVLSTPEAEALALRIAPLVDFDPTRDPEPGPPKGIHP